MHDVLSDVLDTLELESSVYFRAELTSPFSIAVPENKNVVRFHIAGEGRCSISVAGEAPIEFAPGDLVLIPHGASHVLANPPNGSARPLPEVLDASGFTGPGPLVYGGGGDRTTLVCGHFGFSAAVTHPFIETLPAVLHLERAQGPDYRWVEQMLAFADQESQARATGWQGVVERLSQILLVYVLRAYMERESAVAGALSALADPQLAAALQSIHTSPATDWTLDALAHKAGMSRSAFVRKFNSTCGISPMRYLTRWRMSRARYLLTHTETSAGEAAAQAGYASEAAFHRSFKEHVQKPPATYRRQERATAEMSNEPIA
ncbi:MAG: AraC family transcriptional regulator [Proteobacteria bacterium]|nr:AraC family transcriptional regulator [Pseudomonadota bacterium]